MYCLIFDHVYCVIFDVLWCCSVDALESGTKSYGTVNDTNLLQLNYLMPLFSMQPCVELTVHLSQFFQVLLEPLTNEYCWTQ